MNYRSRPALASTVSALPDRVLLAQTRSLARHEQVLQILVLDHLREIESRRLYLGRGFSSLFDYAVRELEYSDGAAWRRIKAMHLCADDSLSARERLEDGSLSLSAAAQLQNTFERWDRDAARGSGNTTVHVASGRMPGGSAPLPGAASATEQQPGPPLNPAAREELVKQAAGKSTREVKQMLASVDPESALPNDRVRALGGGRWELKVVIDAECQHGLEKLKALLSHIDPHQTVGQIIGRLVRDGLDRYDPARPRRGRRKSGQASNGSATPGGQGTSTPSVSAAPVSAGRTSPAKLAGRRAQTAGSATTRAEGTTTVGHASPSVATPSDRATGNGTSPAKPRCSGNSSPPPRHRAQTADRAVSCADGTGTGGSAFPSVATPSDRATGNGTSPAKGSPPQSRNASRPTPRRTQTAESAASLAEQTTGGCALPLVVTPSAGAIGNDASPAEDAPSCAGDVPLPVWQRAQGASRGRGGALVEGPTVLTPVRCTSAAKQTGDRAHGAGPPRRCGARRAIPLPVKREVWRRDGGACSFVDPDSGRRCGSRFLLEIDHVVPYARGGSHEAGNLRLYCGAHHRYRHADRRTDPEHDE